MVKVIKEDLITEFTCLINSRFIKFNSCFHFLELFLLKTTYKIGLRYLKKRKIKYLSFILILIILIFKTSSAQDNTPPERAYIDYVTVDTATNNTLIFWEKSPSTDVEWYNLYYEVQTPNGPEGVLFDSVSADFSSYVHIDGGADAGSILYSISAEDSSGNESLRTPGLHNSLFIKQKYDSCQNIMTLSWNKYIGWENRLSGYIIHWRTEAGTFQSLTGVNPEDSVHLHYEIQNNTQYYYLVFHFYGKS